MDAKTTEAVELLRRLIATPSTSRDESRTADLLFAFLEGGRRWAESGGVRPRGRGEVAGLGLDSVQQGEEKAFLFFFLLPNSYFPFCLFFF